MCTAARKNSILGKAVPLVQRRGAYISTGEMCSGGLGCAAHINKAKELLYNQIDSWAFVNKEHDYERTSFRPSPMFEIHALSSKVHNLAISKAIPPLDLA